MKRALTKTRLVAIVIFLLLAGAYTGGTIYLNSSAFRQLLLQQVNKAIDGRVAVKGHDLALHASSLELSGVQLTSARGEPLASIQRLRIKLFLPALMWGTIHIPTVEIQQVRCHIRYDLQDRLQGIKVVSPTDPAKKDDNAGWWTLRLDDFHLNDGAVSFQRPAKGMSANIVGLKMMADFDSAAPNGRLEIRTGPLNWQQPDGTYTLPTLKASASVETLKAITLSLETHRSSLKASGHLDLSTAPFQMDWICDLKVDPEEFHALLPKKTGLKGLVTARITTQGSLEDPTVTLKTTWQEGAVMGVPVDKLVADLKLHQRKLSIAALRNDSNWGALDITGIVDLQPVFDNRLDFGTAQWEKLTYDLKLKAKQLKPDRLDVLGISSVGTFKLAADITGSGLASPRSHGKAHIDLQATGLAPGKVASPGADGHLIADIQRKGPVIELEKLRASTSGSDLEATARIDSSAGRIKQAAVNLQSSDLETLGAVLGSKLPSGSAVVKLNCHGPFKRPTAHINLLAQALAMDDRPLGRLLAEARLNEQGILDISRVVLENQGSLVQGSGKLTLTAADGGFRSDPGVEWNMAFEQLEPKDFGETASAGSNFSGSIHLYGSVQHLQGNAVLEKSAVNWDGFGGYVKGDALWDDGRLTIKEFNLFNEASSVQLDGTAIWRQSAKDPWSAQPDVQAHIQGRDIRIQDFLEDHSGTITLAGQVSGPPSDLTGQFRLSGGDLDIGGQAFKAVNLKGRMEQDTVYCETMEITVVEGQKLSAEGWYALDKRFMLNMTAPNIGLSHISKLQQANPIEGRLDFRLDGHGTIDDPQINADLTIHAPRVDGRPWDDFHLTAQVLEQQVKVKADLNFNLVANVQLNNGDFDLQAKFDDSDLGPYLSISAGPQWHGKLSGSLQAKGNRHHPDQIQGDLKLNDTALRYQDETIVSLTNLQASLVNGRLELPLSRLALMQNGYINLSATGQWPTALHFESQGRLPIAALTPFLETTGDAKGEATFKASAQGPLDGMQWQAALELIGTSFEIPGLGQQVENLNGSVKITPEHLLVEDISGGLDGGRFTLKGEMPLKGWMPYGGRLALNAQALPLQLPDTMDAVLNGDLSLEGGDDRLTLSGGIVLLEGSYYKDVKLNLLSAVTQKTRAVPVSSEYEVPGIIGKTDLNVGVTHRYPLLVDNNLANLQIAPDIKISGTLSRPILSGRAEVVEGEVIFRRKTFEVKRGVVDFINPYKIEPNIDIVAETDIRQWHVSLSLSGPPDQLVFELSSDPAASENDILSLILLGSTNSELAKGESSGSQTTQQMLTALIATAWGEDVKKRSGVDILEVETGADDDQESADRVQVTVGKKLSRRLTLKYEVESGSDELVQRAISEYQFLEHLLASGFQDSKGGYGGEMLFRIEF